MQHASQHITYTVPTDATRVRRLLKSITYAALESAKDVLHNDLVKMLDFELAADYLLEQAGNKKIKDLNQKAQI
jgi:hypothetical protein